MRSGRAASALDHAASSSSEDLPSAESSPFRRVRPPPARGGRRKLGSVYDAVLCRRSQSAQPDPWPQRVAMPPPPPPPPTARHHASFSEEQPHPPPPPPPPPVLRRESMTRLFLKPDAVFKAYEHELFHEPQPHHRHSLAPRPKPPLEDKADAAQLLSTTTAAVATSSSSTASGSNSGSSAQAGGLEPAEGSNGGSSTQCATVLRPTSSQHGHHAQLGPPDSQARAEPRTHRSSSVHQAHSLKAVEESGQRRSSSAMDTIRKEDPEQVYRVYKQLGTGRFGFVKLAQHKATRRTMALKFFPRDQTKQVGLWKPRTQGRCFQTDFLREYSYSKTLGAHPNIINTYDGVFQALDESAFYFVQEFCPHASLREAVEGSPGGIGEERTKGIMLSLLAAIEFMHSEGLVHRNIKAENILIFDLQDYNKIKVTDFGLTRKVDSTVKHLEYVNQYHAPELCDTVVNEMCTVTKALDIWALGVIFYYCLRGRHPWQKASIMCKPYWEWEQWLKHKLAQLPRRYEVFTERGIKLQKRCLNPRAKDRWSVKDMRRALEKDKFMKPAKAIPKHAFHSMDDCLYDEPHHRPTRSGIHHWITNTLTTMAEISEQVVSARNQ